MSSKKILVAEDSSVLQNLIKKILSHSTEFELDSAKNGKEVLLKLEKFDYALILMDINMPKMNGVDCAKNIRALDDSGKSKVPIVAITGNALNMSEEDFKAVGINDFLPKPIDFDALVALVKKWTA